jgi:hypothetical protein
MKMQDDEFVDSAGIFEWREEPVIKNKNNETDWVKERNK